MYEKRVEIIWRKVLGELKAIKTDKIKDLEEIEIKVLLLEERINARKLWNDLDKFEI